MNEWNTLEGKQSICYARFSTDDQEKGDSEGRQRLKYAEYCRRYGLVPGEFLIDKGLSGWKGENIDNPDSQLNLLINQRIKKDMVVCVQRGCRLTRQGVPRYCEVAQKMFRAGAGNIIIDDEILDNKNYGDNIKVLMDVTLGKMESDKKSENVQAAMDKIRRQIKEGKFAKLSVLPEWLSENKDETGFNVDWDIVKFIKKVFTLYKNGLPPHRIAAKFNVEKIGPIRKKWYKEYTRIEAMEARRQRGREVDPNNYVNNRIWNGWRDTAIRDILQNEAVIGQCRWGNHRRHNGEVEYEAIKYPLWPKIIDDNLFYSVQKSLAKKAKGRQTNNLLVFGSLLRCKHCGIGMLRHVSSKWSNHFFCPNFLSKICDSKKSGQVNETQFTKSIQLMLDKTDQFNAFDNNTKMEELKLDGLKGRLEIVNKQLEKYNKTFEREDNPPDAVIQSITKYNEERKKLDRDIKIEEVKIKGFTPGKEALDQYGSLKNKWEDKESQYAIRECLHNIFDRIEIDRVKKYYTAYFSGGEEPIEVQLYRKYCVINGVELKY